MQRNRAIGLSVPPGAAQARRYFAGTSGITANDARGSGPRHTSRGAAAVTVRSQGEGLPLGPLGLCKRSDGSTHPSRLIRGGAPQGDCGGPP